MDSKAGTLADALKVASVFKKHVNERYRLLEIDLDAVFQRVLLLQKKKYAAVKVETSGQTSIEIKGLDMKRREYCALSKNVSKWVIIFVFVYYFAHDPRFISGKFLITSCRVSLPMSCSSKSTTTFVPSGKTSDPARSAWRI